MAVSAPTSPRLAFERAVERLRAAGVIEGALLVSRDGFPLAGHCPGVPDTEVFAAMHATALGAAEIALRGLGVSLVAERAGQRFVSRGVTPSLFVVAVVAQAADCRAVHAWIDELGSVLS